jgi:hypothetical protein
MAVSKEKAAVEQTAAEKAVAKAAPVQAESVYTAEELAANAGKLFGVRTECAAAALKAAGIKECTVSKAGETVKTFMKKEVR